MYKNDFKGGGWLVAILILSMAFVSAVPIIYDKGWRDATT